jgi:hypothetical protein
MINITLKDEYEKAIVKLALRQFAQSQLQNAVNEFKANKVSDGRDSSERGQAASAIADRIN